MTDIAALRRTRAADPRAQAKSASSKRRTRGRRQSLVFALICLAVVPIEIGPVAGVDLSFADFVGPLLIPYLIASRDRSRWLSLYVALVSLSLLMVLVMRLFGLGGLHPLLTLFYYVKPWLIFFAAAQFIRNAADPRERVDELLRVFAWIEAFTILLILAAYAKTGHLLATVAIRDGSTAVGFTAGEWSLTPRLFGYGQVNVTSAYLVLGTPLFLHRIGRTRATRLVWVAIMVTSWSFILQSGSRGALLGLLAFGVVYASQVGSAAQRGRAVLNRIVLAIGLIVATRYAYDVFLSASVRYGRSFAEFRAGNFESLSTGRLNLASVAFHDVLRSPFVGTAYQDFRRFHSTEIFANTSPHNQYLGAFSKGGVFIGLGFIVLMLHAASSGRVLRTVGLRVYGWPLVVALYLFLFPVLDALTTPVLSAAILAILGAVNGLEAAIDTGVSSRRAMNSFQRFARRSGGEVADRMVTAPAHAPPREATSSG